MSGLHVYAIALPKIGTLKNIPLGKYGSGEDIAKTVAFLASPASGHTTGTNVVIDGGFTKGVQF